MAPGLDVGIHGAEPRAARALRRNRGVVDQAHAVRRFRSVGGFPKRVVSAWSARSTWMWSSGPAPHGHTSGKACREQVMTRQPALENRSAVAWPMPRLLRSGAAYVAARWTNSTWRPSSALINQGYSRTLAQACAAASRRNSMRSCRRNGRSCQNSKRVGAMRQPFHPAAWHLADHAWRRPPRSPLRTQTGFRAVTACWPRRRSGPASAAWRNRRRFGVGYRRHVAADADPTAQRFPVK